MQRLKKEVKGITLMVLVITIIVMLILASVVVKLTLGDGGVLSEARNAANEWDKVTEEEQSDLSKLAQEMRTARNGIYNRTIGSGDTNTGNSTSGGDTNQNLTDILAKMEELESKLTVAEQKIEHLEGESKSINNIYPVGSIYITTDLSTTESVASKLGGTWENYGQGRTLVGVGTGQDENGTSLAFAINSQGGEYKHTLNIEEMPAHTHFFGKTEGKMGYIEGGYSAQILHEPSGELPTGAAGGSQAHNNIQPYITVYMYKRIS